MNDAIAVNMYTLNLRSSDVVLFENDFVFLKLRLIWINFVICPTLNIYI